MGNFRVFCSRSTEKKINLSPIIIQYDDTISQKVLINFSNFALKFPFSALNHW